MDDDSKKLLRRQLDDLRSLDNESARQAWVIDQKTLDDIAASFASLPDVEVRVVVALFYASNDVETLFTSQPHDVIMRSEALRFRSRVDAHLLGATSSVEFADDIRRASRFYKAWTAEDQRLMREVADDAGQDAIEVQAPDLPGMVASIARRAFWDVIRNDVQNGRYDSLLNVLEEMQQSMMALIAHSPSQQDGLQDRFDVNWIRQQLAHDAFDERDARKLMHFLAQTIREWHAVADAELGTALAMNDTADDFWSGTLIDFLADAHLHLGVIYARIIDADAARVT